MRPAITPELPPPRREPIARTGGPFARLSKAERRVADFVLADAEVFHLVRSRSRVDVGGWLRGRRVWVAAGARELVLFAHGPRPYSQTIPFAELRSSVYNPVTGELALKPCADVRAASLRMSPLDAYQLLAQIYAAPESAPR